MHSRSRPRIALSPTWPLLFALIGCAERRPDFGLCAIERPSPEVMDEQAAEAERDADPKREPLLPATYRWLERLDHDHPELFWVQE